MTEYINTTLGLDLVVRVPFQTSDEYDALAGRKNAWWEEIVAQTCYKNFNPEFGQRLAAKLVEVTGVPMPTTGVVRKNRQGEEVAETITAKKFVLQLLAADKITEEALRELGQSIASEMPPLSVSSAAEGRLTAEWREIGRLAYDAMVAKGNLEEAVATFLNSNPGAPLLEDGEEITADYIGMLKRYKAKLQVEL